MHIMPFDFTQIKGDLLGDIATPGSMAETIGEKFNELIAIVGSLLLSGLNFFLSYLPTVLGVILLIMVLRFIYGKVQSKLSGVSR